MNTGRIGTGILFGVVFFLVCSVSIIAAPKIAVKVQVSAPAGRWTIDLDQASLTGGAGSDFVSPVESAADLVDVDVTKPVNAWRLDISRIDTVWHPNIRIYAQRTTDGTGTGTISGGGTYQEITTTDQVFFSGTLDRNGIKIQLSVDVDSTIGVNNFSTTIYYTATDI